MGTSPWRLAQGGATAVTRTRGDLAQREKGADPGQATLEQGRAAVAVTAQGLVETGQERAVEKAAVVEAQRAPWAAIKYNPATRSLPGGRGSRGPSF